MTMNKLDILDENDIWIFTKQSTEFDNAFLAVKLFSEILGRKNINIEEYFANNYMRYGINTDRHRMLVISQMFGLLTKTPFYTRGQRYNAENPTAMFDLLNSVSFGGKEYNTYKTEQLLKIKLRAIIDTASNNRNAHILPVIFTFCVLSIAKSKFGFDSISLNKFYTYVATCKDFSEIDDAVENVINGASADQDLIAIWKDRSRIKPLFESNFNLFVFSGDSIRINPIFETYFQREFIDKMDLDELLIQLTRDVDYAYFLYNFQDFGVNLIDSPNDIVKPQIEQSKQKSRVRKVVNVSMNEIEDDDNDYVEKVDNVKVININEDVAIGAHLIKPAVTSMGQIKRYSKNPTIGKVAIKQTEYKCLENVEHFAFISPKTNESFMEAHHLIPITQLEIMWGRFAVNIDCIENLVSLCPNCHRAIHYGSNDTKKSMLTKLFKLREEGFKKIGLNITIDELLLIYK